MRSQVSYQAAQNVLHHLIDGMQASDWLQQGVQKLEAQPEHQEDVPTQDELAEMQHSIRKLLQLKEAGNK